MGRYGTIDDDGAYSYDFDDDEYNIHNDQTSKALILYDIPESLRQWRRQGIQKIEEEIDVSSHHNQCDADYDSNANERIIARATQEERDDIVEYDDSLNPNQDQIDDSRQIEYRISPTSSTTSFLSISFYFWSLLIVSFASFLMGRSDIEIAHYHERALLYLLKLKGGDTSIKYQNRCPLSIDHVLRMHQQKGSSERGEWSHGAVEEYLLNEGGIVGQDPAVSILSQSIQTWMTSSDGMMSYGVRPLSMVIIGRSGVGKSFSAEVISRMLFQECMQIGNDFAGYLNLDGGSFAVPSLEDSDKSMTNRTVLELREIFKKQIADHISNQDKMNGAIVVLNDFEEVHPEILNVLSTALKSSKISFYDETLRSTKQADCSKTLFILTSTEKKFTSIIHSFLYNQAYGEKTQVPIDFLQSKLAEEIESNFRHKAYSNLGIVVPFFPIFLNDLFEMFKRKVEEQSRVNNKRWQQLFVTDDAVDYFISGAKIAKISSPAIQSPLIIVLKGGDELNIMLFKFWGYVNKHFTQNRQDEVALFDYEKNTKRFRLSWCKSYSEESAYKDDQQRYYPNADYCQLVWNDYAF